MLPCPRALICVWALGWAERGLEKEQCVPLARWQKRGRQGSVELASGPLLGTPAGRAEGLHLEDLERGKTQGLGGPREQASHQLRDQPVLCLGFEFQRWHLGLGRTQGGLSRSRSGRGQSLLPASSELLPGPHGQ